MPSRAALWWGSLEGADLETLVVSAGHAGFAAVSTAPAMYFAARERGRTDRELRALLDDHAVTVTMVDPLLRGLPGARSADLVGRRWRATFVHDEDDCHRVADALDVELINVAHFLGAPVATTALVDAIGAITQRAAARGRAIVIEAMPEGAIPDIATACAIAEGVSDRACGLTVDTWHWWRSGGDLAELRALPSGFVRAVQLSDAQLDVRGSFTEPPVRDRLLPGSGVVPLVSVLGLLRSRHPSAHVGLEVFDRAHVDRSFDAIAGAAAHALAALEAQVAAAAGPGIGVE